MTYQVQVEAVCPTEAGMSTAYFSKPARSIRAALTAVADQIEFDFGSELPVSVTVIISKVPNGPA